ncbi:cell cycle regulator of non-homologous end joining [Brienomyrus brachyistius]|uniref:cell cycle regulator of non-homologous end joining n=1 Tax=Brienomyrus brachyistius TaxID=42636 RepID=UPI0020B25EBD|nr:cell cycle regulator of non-homologous end joining [Brienomyrus brachyistius]
MDNRQRDLPSWMLGGKNEQPQQENPIKTSHVPRKNKRKKLERTAVYGMNEAELVDTALSFLKEENLQGFRAQEPTGQKRSRRTAGSRMERNKQDRAGALSEEEAGDSKSEEDERTHVSESDPEVVAEEETVPYGAIANWGQAAGEGVQLRSTRDTVKADSASGDEEALQLVRDIFFT